MAANAIIFLKLGRFNKALLFVFFIKWPSFFLIILVHFFHDTDSRMNFHIFAVLFPLLIPLSLLRGYFGPIASTILRRDPSKS